MENISMLQIITQQGVSKWNQHRHEHINLPSLDLIGVNLSNLNLSNINLYNMNLNEGNLANTDLTKANLSKISLRSAYLVEANLSQAKISSADISGANLSNANLSNANLSNANLSGANLSGANLSGANLWHVAFDNESDLTNVIFWDSINGGAKLRQVKWNNVDITCVPWEIVRRLGDDTGDNTTPEKLQANRQVATLLRGQGLNEDADRLLYQAQLFKRSVFREKGVKGIIPFLGSLLLDLVAGYGYKPTRTFVAYVLTILSFAIGFYLVTHSIETQLAHLSWDEALVLSLTSFHGRGFFSGLIPLGDWVARLGAAEAVIGLFIELILIATFSRRFLGE